MLPACLVAILLGRPSRGYLLAGAALAGVVVAAWAIPMIDASGGWDAYSNRSSRLYDYAASGTSLFYGGAPGDAFYNAASAIVAAIVIALPALIALALARVLGDRLAVPRNRSAWAILLAWVVPNLAHIYLCISESRGTSSP